MINQANPRLYARVHARHVDIFCRVIDNYGDIGVCWRLARRLADGHGWQVRLWVDDLHSFARLACDLNPASTQQWLGAIEVVLWSDSPAPESTPGDLVIEAFACDPPVWFVEAMRVRPVAPVWINLEYLSAEHWIADFHAQASLRGDGLRKTFFFPGFSPVTGGLLREPGLFVARDDAQRSPASRAATLRALGLTVAADGLGAPPSPRLASLFCYPTMNLSALFDALAQTGPWIVAIPQGVAVEAETLALIRQGPDSRRPALTVERFALLSQLDYDRLLWCADLNIVRGEDSFVRAQWAARPMLWHIYPQNEATHLQKLNAWLSVSECLPLPTAVMQTMNAPPATHPAGDRAPTHPPGALTAALTSALQAPQWNAWQRQAREWATKLGEMSDLADNLVAHYDEVANSR